MEVIIFILCVIIVLLIVNIRSTLSARYDLLQQRIEALSNELKKIVSMPRREEKSTEATGTADESFAARKMAAEPIKASPPPLERPQAIVPTVELPKTAPIPVRQEPVNRTPDANKPPKIRKPGFFERNPDLEKFIGENLANKIGIGILVLGIGFFVKYAIDQDWINEIGRVAIGILCGGILLAIAHRMRKTFPGFSSVLVGGGIAVLYLTIAIAYHEYGIFGQTAAFVLMLFITAFTVVLSLGYDRMELAILSILGGFASPFMVSSGEGNFIALFTYVLILDCGMLALAYYKKWNPVNIICYAFTVILFGSWLGTKFQETDIGMIAWAMTFSTLFYIIFFAMNVVNNIKQKMPFKAIEIGILLSNTFFYYAAGMVVLNNYYDGTFKGLFTAALGIFNFVFAYMLYRNQRVDRNLVFLLIGLVLTFISLAAPVQLEGNYITLFWAAETLLLLWLSQRSGIRIMKLASVVIMALMVISLLMDWEQLYVIGGTDLMIVVNKGYITGILSMASIAGVIRLLRNENSENPEYIRLYKTVLTVVGVLLLYTSQFFELRHQLFAYGFDYAAQNIIIGAFNMAFILGLLLFENKLVVSALLRKAFAFWGLFALATYLFFYHWQVIDARDEFLQRSGSATGFVFHYVLVGIMIAVAAISIKRMQGLTEFNEKTYNLYSWAYIFFFVFIASAELDHVVLLSSYTPDKSPYQILTQNHKIGFPILWGISSFVLIAVGLKLKKRHLRIISLTLFLITLLKLFLVDIKGISEGGKIAAFISLGVLLLIVSFMYQRLKKLLLADEVVIEKKDSI